MAKGLRFWYILENRLGLGRGLAKWSVFMKLFSKLMLKTPKQREQYCFAVVIDKSGHISRLLLVLLFGMCSTQYSDVLLDDLEQNL